MRIHPTHHWRRYEGVFVFALCSVHWGPTAAGITIANFCLEIEFI